MNQPLSDHPIIRSSDHLTFELVTPERLAYSSAVTMVEVPGELGDFGVLPGHAPFFSMIRPGVIRVHEKDGGQKRYFVVSGYAEVNPESCTILSDKVRTLDSIDVAEANRELDAAKAEIQNAKDDTAKEKAEKSLRQAEALHYAVTHR